MRTAIVTGGGRGIGRAIAVALGVRGTMVVVVGRTRRDLAAAARDVTARGGEALVVTMDVSDAISVGRAVSKIRRAVRHVDVLVNNAGVGGGTPIVESSVDEWRRIVDTNLVGPYLVSRAVVPIMRDGGRIVNVASVLGRFGVSGYTAYCASKHGVIGFTRALALELVDRKITVNAVAPGWVDTEMAAAGMHQGAEANGWTFETFREHALAAVPIKRIIAPAEVASLVSFLCAADASAITGQTYNICGGQTMD